MKKYNTTQLSPDQTFERHVFHRDQFAHYLRWTHILKEVKIGEKIVDFGCGSGNLLEVLYRNRFKQAFYVGIDIKNTAKDHLKKIEWAEFVVQDVINPTIDLSVFQADKVCSFEVIEHVGKQNITTFLNNLKQCGNDNAMYYISTPNFDEKVGAAGNHTFDSGDERGIDIQEFTYNELEQNIKECGFRIIKTFGTFASIKDYKHLLNDWQSEMFNYLREYYDSNLISNIMAPFFPKQSRNTLWVLKSQ